MLELLFKLLIGHALADFALQSDVMAKGKNRHNKPSYIPDGQAYTPCWPYWLLAHGSISGGVVYYITGSILFGLIETGAHCVIDFMKCENITNPHIDQFLHLICRITYLV